MERGLKRNEIHLGNDEKYLLLLNELYYNLIFLKNKIGKIMDYKETWLCFFNEEMSGLLEITDEDGNIYSSTVCFSINDKFKIIK